MSDLNIKNYAHIGDALWEVFVREKTIFLTGNLLRLHKITVHYVKAEFQAQLLNDIKSFLTEDEQILIKRAGNIKTSSLRKIDRNLHRLSTEFEALLGYNYIHNKQRYEEILNKINEFVKFDLSELND